MKIRWSTFNIYLLGAIFLVGCKSPQEKIDAADSRRQKKEVSTIRFHIEASDETPGRTSPVPVLRAAPVMVNVYKEPFLSEHDVLGAVIADYMGGFVIQIQFDPHGTFVLDSVSTSSKGKRVAIMSDFGEKRWLAAPLLTRRIADGVITFTPDATREEAERIVRGLNNAATKLKKQHIFAP
jgi:hypothetical protein